ncbi:TIGR04211 family SH3 domain-containing protein [Desulfonatronum thiodismutans]|uniref:TIGR04211 family SH3 domain-containing protein n=1 Tax=Desulfonatronum thiodismutans TaxID=159290 RepID=UPI001378CEF4|nr:TIGR04211 family SH3 domain-containing protein [Desulfonatronum thiodismutans]
MKTNRIMRFVVGFSLVSVLAWLPGIAGAVTVYVSDVREISKRVGPSTEHRILQMLPAGAKMEVLSEQAGWLRVRGPNNIEGWVLKRFTSEDVPVSLKYQELRKIYDELYAASSGALGRVAELEEVNQNLLETLSETSNRLLDLDREHAAFQLDAANVLDLRQRYDQTVVDLADAQVEVEALRQENNKLKSWDRFHWFLVGGAVFLVAWLTGVITGRLQGKRRNTLQYT